MRVLVTGGAGFVGSHLVDGLLARGRNVVVLDDLSAVLHRPAAALPDRVTFIEGSVEDREAVREAARGCAEIYHLAAVVGVRRVVSSPARTLRCAVRGTANACEAAAREGALLLFASSSEVYGGGAVDPLREDAPLPPPLPGPRGTYGRGKRLAEAIVRRASPARGFPAIIVRLFNVVGPRQVAQTGMVLPAFVARALRDRPLAIHGDGSQRRCFAFVRDVVEDLLGLAGEPRARGDTVNVGREEETSIVDLARHVVERTGSRSSLRFVPLERIPERRIGPPDRRRPSLERLRSLLGPRDTAPLDAVIDAVTADVASRVLVEG